MGHCPDYASPPTTEQKDTAVVIQEGNDDDLIKDEKKVSGEKRKRADDQSEKGAQPKNVEHSQSSTGQTDNSLMEVDGNDQKRLRPSDGSPAKKKKCVEEVIPQTSPKKTSNPLKQSSPNITLGCQVDMKNKHIDGDKGKSTNGKNGKNGNHVWGKDSANSGNVVQVKSEGPKESNEAEAARSKQSEDETGTRSNGFSREFYESEVVAHYDRCHREGVRTPYLPYPFTVAVSAPKRDLVDPTEPRKELSPSSKVLLACHSLSQAALRAIEVGKPLRPIRRVLGHHTFRSISLMTRQQNVVLDVFAIVYSV